LLEYFQQIEFVPLLDPLPMLRAPDRCFASGSRTVGLTAHECLTEGSVAGEAGADALALSDHVVLADSPMSALMSASNTNGSTTPA
jgi:hypothetical protein